MGKKKSELAKLKFPNDTMRDKLFAAIISRVDRHNAAIKAAGTPSPFATNHELFEATGRLKECIDIAYEIATPEGRAMIEDARTKDEDA